MGSGIGFMLYYYLLARIEAGRVALSALISPLVALWLGAALNGEPVSGHILAGTGLILMALGLHQLGGRRRAPAPVATSWDTPHPPRSSST